MTRACAGLGRRERRVVRCERALGRVEPVDHHLVDAKVRDVGEPIARIDVDRMRVRCLLALRVDARTRVLDEGRCRLQRTIRADRQHRDTPAAIIRNEDVLAAVVDDEVRRAATDRRLPVQRGERAGLAVDREGADRPAGLALVGPDFVDRVERDRASGVPPGSSGSRSLPPAPAPRACPVERSRRET